MADEQGPKDRGESEEATATKSVACGQSSARSARLTHAVERMMRRGTFASEVKSEARRCLAIAQAVGIRLEREVNCKAKADAKWTPDESFINRYLGYNLGLVRLMESERALAKEIRLSLKDVPTDTLSDQMRGVMQRELGRIMVEPRRAKEKAGA